MFSAQIEIGANLLAFLTLLTNGVLGVMVYRRTKELKPNGGNSVHDKVSKLYEKVVEEDGNT